MPRITRPISWTHIITWVAMFVALIAGMTFNNQRINDNEATQHELCAAVLTLSRNLFYPLPVDATTSPELVHYTQEVLGPLYYRQFHQLDKRFDLEARCGGTLPKGTPPSPPKPG